MPFLDGVNPEMTPKVDGFDAQAYVPPDLTWTPDLSSVGHAFFQQENTVGAVAHEAGFRWSLYAAHQAGDNPTDPNYDAFNDPNVTQYLDSRPEQAHSFAYAKSSFEAWRIRQRIDQEDENNETMANASTSGVALMIAMGAIDPVNLLPVGVGVDALRAGKVLKGALRGSAAGFTAGAASEGILQSTQETRTSGQSLANIASSTILSGVLGGGLSMLSPAERIRLGETFGNEVKAAHDEFNAPQGGGGSGGAAAVRTSTLADETPVGAFGVEKLGANKSPVGNPMQRLLASPSIIVRRIVRDLAEIPLRFAGEAKGQAAPQAVQTKIGIWNGNLATAVKSMDDAFVAHRFGKPTTLGQTRAGIQDVTGQRGSDKLTYDQFKQRVAMAMRRGDEDPIPEVARAARDMRKSLIDPLKQEAIDLGLLPKDVEVSTAASYFTRVYDTPKIIAKRPEFEQILQDWLRSQKDEATGAAASQAAGVEPASSGNAISKNPDDLRAAVSAGFGPYTNGAERVDRIIAGWADKPGETRHAIMRDGKPVGMVVGHIEGDTFHVDWLDTKGLPEGQTPRSFREIGRQLASELPDDVQFLEGIRSTGARLDSSDARQTTGRLPLRGLRGPAEGAAAKEAPSAKASADHAAMAAVDDADFPDIARQITDKILGNNGVGIFQPVPIKGRSLKERTLNIPDRLIEGFLDNDSERVARIYKRQMASDVELTRAFGKPDLQDQIDNIAADFARVRKTVDPKNEKTLKILDAQLKQNISDVEDIRDRIKGRYGIPDDPNGLMVRAFRVARTLNYIRLGGGFAVGSIPDVGQIVFNHGFGRLFKNGLAPIISNRRLFNLARSEVKRAGAALDWVLDTRAMSFADIGDDYGRHSKFERGVQYLGDKFGMMNVMSGWNATMKQLAGVMTQTRMIEEVSNLVEGKISKADAAHLAWLGIDGHTAERIAEQFKTHGETGEGVSWANTQAWTDRDAVDAFRAAIQKESNVTITEPGQDKPLWMSKEWGKVIGQFRSFAMSSMLRVTASGLQRRDAATFQGLVSMVTLGMLSYALKTRPEDLSGNPVVWFKEGIDRSGVTGWLFDANNIMEKMAGGVGVDMAIGGPSARYASRGVSGALAGPSADIVEDTATLMSHVVNGEWSASDTHRIRKFLPYQNLFYLRWLIDQAEKGVNTATGTPDRRKPKVKLANE